MTKSMLAIAGEKKRLLLAIGVVEALSSVLGFYSASRLPGEMAGLRRSRGGGVHAGIARAWTVGSCGGWSCGRCIARGHGMFRCHDVCSRDFEAQGFHAAGVLLPLLGQTVLFWQVFLAFTLLRKQLNWVQVGARAQTGLGWRVWLCGAGKWCRGAHVLGEGPARALHPAGCGPVSAQVLGVMLVVFGVTAAAWPGAGSSVFMNMDVASVLIYCVSMLFPALDSILKERLFRWDATHVDVLPGRVLAMRVIVCVCVWWGEREKRGGRPLRASTAPPSRPLSLVVGVSPPG